MNDRISIIESIEKKDIENRNVRFPLLDKRIAATTALAGRRAAT